MFKIYDGRKEFFQWDLEQKLIVSDPTVNEVHFSHQVDSESLVCEVYELDGLRVVNVPNILLQEDWKINVYAYCSNYTKVSACFKVIPKAKPADYVYTETEVMSWQEYGERIAALEANGDGIKEITEETFLPDLPTGIYKINCQDDSYCIWLDDCYWYGLSSGIIMVSYDELNQAFEWMFVGRDINYIEGTQRGRTHWDTEWEYWVCESFGEIEYDHNRVSDLTDPRNVSVLKYPSSQAVVDYVDNTKAEIVDTVKEEWVELLNITLAEDIAYVDLVAEEGKKFKKIHIHIQTNSAGLSAASKIIILGSSFGEFNGHNGQNLTITSGSINTWGYPVFIIEKGELFPIAFSSQGAVNGNSSSAVYMGGVGQTLVNNGGWKAIRIQPQTANVVFKAGVIIYAWGVYENENND